ncbi:hypothetical protein FWF74_02755 [Candidatus Saccharibacteria bacterium]|nr:hypothetical protein [Candidatus Saccharibacteria bacterium]MCL1962690.1 hypothetical protein [Candidatus Saccharibacteria bacterium]
MSKINWDMIQGVDRERPAELQNRWDAALGETAMTLFPGVNWGGVDLVAELEKLTHANFHREHEKLILGLNGPGASGKGTFGRHILTTKGYLKIVNDTTRAKRDGEVEGEDYYYISEEEFFKRRDAGEYLMTLERPGRGWYGTRISEVALKLAQSRKGVLFEDNPENQIKLFNSDFIREQKNVDLATMEILPRTPLIETSIIQLQKRLSEEPDPAKRILTQPVFEATLGDRQVDEFMHFEKLAQQPGVQPVVVMSGDADRAKHLIDRLPL